MPDSSAFRLFSARYYYVLAVLLLLAFAATLYGRIVHFDDAWMAEQSYWLLRDGHVHSEFFRGLNRAEEHQFITHKLFVYFQAGLMAVFGSGTYVAKSTALIFWLVGLLLLLRYFRRSTAEARWLAAVLYLGCGGLMQFGFDGRPETMSMSFGLTSFMLLRAPGARAGRLALAGLAGGLAALSTLNGLVFLGAGGLWLLLRRGWGAAFVFGLAGGLTVSLYALESVFEGQFALFLYQFGHFPEMQSNLHWWSKLAVMAGYHHVFLHSEGETFLTVLALGTVALTWQGRRTPLSAATLYLLLLLGVFWVLTKSNSAFYFLLFVPFLIIVVVERVTERAAGLSRARRRWLQALLLLYPVGAGLRTYYLLRENQTYIRPEVENARLARYMPRHGTRIIGPLDFFFGQEANYRIHSLTYYAYLNASDYDNKLSLPQFFDLAARDSVAYVVTDHRRRNHVYLVPETAPARIGRYQRVYQNQWHSVYARRE
ncbi:hypothetical protein Q5H93_19575 [Hymenobacter sp. ASUV-10]|uniref:Glycosyltransferase RgtA/B/C/D-like domain-containing protein n=1 Tax=Hymenobacter aranciens TaxID=3063996 RepID=A0ABT9BJY1_9BACT|nr:hypothetical protein [Hymenobacter sp. ASUV-10]MDO7876956.1 hypothetical protein [Hymenobacter sp. ASUV-10]